MTIYKIAILTVLNKVDTIQATAIQPLYLHENFQPLNNIDNKYYPIWVMTIIGIGYL